MWQEDYTLGDTLGCLILETLICSEFASSPSGRKVAGACWEDVTLRLFSASSPKDHSKDPGWAWMRTCSDDQLSAVLWDTEGRWLVSWECSSWHNKSRARLGGGQDSLTGLLSAR